MRRKVMAIVSELKQVQRRDAAFSRVSRDQINLSRRQRDVSQRKIHLPHFSKFQSVRFRESRVTVGTRHEILTETRAPRTRVRRGVGNGFQVEVSRVGSSYQNRKRVFKTERRADLNVKLVGVFLFDLGVDGTRIGYGLMVQDRGECCSCVFGIDVESSADERVVGQITAEFETTLNRNATSLEHLRYDFGEQC